jgi:signal transduction histidine kinase
MAKEVFISTSSHGPQKPITREQVEDWIHTTRRKRLELHLLATEPWNSTRRHDAFMHMSELLKEAIEEVRVISASLREGSEEWRAKASRLRECSKRLHGSQPREER